MSTTLLRALLDAHARGRGDPEDPRDALELAPDQALVGGASSALTLAAFAAAGGRRVRMPALACATRATNASIDADREGERARAWRAAGASFAPAGTGRASVLHRDRHAAPGRLALVAGTDAAPSGAFGALALRVSDVELASALAAGTLSIAEPRTIGVVLTGELPAGCGGQDLAFELSRRLPRDLAEGAVLEASGPGVAGLSFADRLALAAHAPRIGAAAAILPSDDVTRAALAARGREADWRRLTPPDTWPGDAPVEIDLARVVPRIAPLDAPEIARPLADASGRPIARVLFGSEACAAELARLATWLSGRRVAAGVNVVAAAGSRAVFEAIERCGALATLQAAGVRVVDAGAPFGWTGEGTGLAFGAAPDEVEEGRGRWYLAHAAACAAAALCGRLAVPQEAGFDPACPAAEVAGGADAALAALDGPGLANGVPLPISSLAGALRAELLGLFGDGVAASDLLRWGARLEPLAGDVRALAAHVLETLDEGFAARAAVRGGGWLAAGRDFGRGEPGGATALALVACGVRVSIALSWGAAFRRAYVDAGGLPLCFAREADYAALMRGDELELPGVPEGLETGRPLVLRNLTQGTHATLRHELTPREVERVRAGGRLAETRARLAAEAVA